MIWRWLERIVSSPSRTPRNSLRPNRFVNGSASSSTPSKAARLPLNPPTEALVVHVFILDEDQARTLWQACGDILGMTEAVPGIDMEWAGAFAARTRTGNGVHQAVLRREHDVFCLSVTMEPDGGWAELERRWDAVSPSGALGVVKLFLVPDQASKPSGAWGAPITTRQGFEVWEAVDHDDARQERRLVVLGQDNAELSAWTWLSGGRQLPPLARYLLHAAKLRYQLRVWRAAGGHGQLRHEADATIDRLLAAVSPSGRNPGQAELVEATRALVTLQARELGLVDRSTRLREMARTVEITAANLAAHGGLFTEDRELAEWFRDQLDDDATYLEAALKRTEQIGALVDRLVERHRQRRQDSVNLGLTGVVGAILMGLAAIQSLQYSVPLPIAVKPAVVTALGVTALWFSLLVVRVVVPERRWPAVLARVGFGLLVAAVTWVVVAAVAGPTAWTWLYGGVAGVLGSLVASRFVRSRY